MRWIHPDHPGRAVRLAYCMNLHPGETVGEIRSGMERIALPLRDRLASGARFGVGMYLPAPVAHALLEEDGAADLDGLASFLADEGLQPFTFNAFPYGGFHEPGLKERVYSPSWGEEQRLAFTVSVARIAERLARRGLLEGVEQVSISTHSGGWGAAVPGPSGLHGCAEGMAGAVVELADIEARGGPSIVLALEAEPRSTANDSTALAELLVVARARAARRLRSERGLEDSRAHALASRHLGTCLDCCHSAVEFESPDRALALAGLGGRLGKIQITSALSLERPGERDGGRAALLALDEPRYLHQVTGRGSAGFERVDDLPALVHALEGNGRAAWLACEEWRCHFHVPVDLRVVEGLGTTRAHAAAIVEAALADPGAWTGQELQLEIETYTWDVLPAPARGTGELVDGLEREYAAVFELLESRGWVRG